MVRNGGKLNSLYFDKKDKKQKGEGKRSQNPHNRHLERNGG